MTGFVPFPSSGVIRTKTHMASALAAGNVPMQDQTKVAQSVLAAMTFASANFGTLLADWAACSDPHRPAGLTPWTGATGVPATACISFDDLSKASKVRVKLPTRTVETIFGGVVGAQFIHVGSEAEVAFKAGRKPACTLCVLGPQTHNIGNGNIRVSNGDVAFNGKAGSEPDGEVIISTNGNVTRIERKHLNPPQGIGRRGPSCPHLPCRTPWPSSPCRRP